MGANDANNTNTKREKLIYPELSYVIVGICFQAQNDIGRYAREKQYGDEIEQRLKEAKVPYRRECRIGEEGNIVDFMIDDAIALEIKAKRMITKDDYYQVQRYLQSGGVKLGLLVNFRSQYLRPMRIVRIDIQNRQKFIQ
jgi:GxxExxY protein